MTQTIDVTLPALFPQQQAIAGHKARFKVVDCGRRWGKTQFAAWEALRRALSGQLVWWVAPTAEVTRRGWKKIVPLAQRIPGTNVRRGVREMVFPGGGLIAFKTADSDAGLLGEGLDYLIIDEAAVVRETAWTQELRPALSDRQGGALFISTPRGRNWFWRAFALGQDPAQSDWQSWQYPTSTNPIIAPSEIESARMLLPERVFQQEYLAEFLEDNGTVFRRVNETATALPDGCDHAGHDIVIGADWGKSNDFTVLTAGCRQCARMVDFDRFNRIDYAFQVERLRSMALRWGQSKVVIMAETNSMGEPVIEQVERAGLRVQAFTTTSASKPPLIESLALALERRELAIFNRPELVSELNAYTMVLNKTTGRPSYSAPDGMHDDCVMSLALMWHGIMRRGGALIA